MIGVLFRFLILIVLVIVIVPKGIRFIDYLLANEDRKTIRNKKRMMKSRVKTAKGVPTEKEVEEFHDAEDAIDKFKNI